ncbi:hypothetical protein R1sor_003394 [Riccia sorocarpa]|uniref:Uncharacterized protein n=1 Tax=Riccia sorocarpa TaxID=122646 RepID=A0ABD3H4G3_9MARC
MWIRGFPLWNINDFRGFMTEAILRGDIILQRPHDLPFVCVRMPAFTLRYLTTGAKEISHAAARRGSIFPAKTYQGFKPIAKKETREMNVDSRLLAARDDTVRSSRGVKQLDETQLLNDLEKEIRGLEKYASGPWVGFPQLFRDLKTRLKKEKRVPFTRALGSTRLIACTLLPRTAEAVEDAADDDSDSDEDEAEVFDDPNVIGADAVAGPSAVSAESNQRFPVRYLPEGTVVPTDFLIHWLATGREDKKAPRVAAHDMASTSATGKLDAVPAYLKDSPGLNLQVPRREIISHGWYGHYPHAFPVIPGSWDNRKTTWESLRAFGEAHQSTRDPVIFRAAMYCMLLSGVIRQRKLDHGLDPNGILEDPTVGELLVTAHWHGGRLLRVIELAVLDDFLRLRPGGKVQVNSTKSREGIFWDVHHRLKRR